MISRGASGVVLSGQWFGKKAAFKFVEIENQLTLHDKISSTQLTVEETIKKLNEKVSEMTSMESTQGSKIVKFYGHYRLVNFVMLKPTFRQQLHVDDDSNLAALLGFKTEEIDNLQSSLAEIEKNVDSEALDIVQNVKVGKKSCLDYMYCTDTFLLLLEKHDLIFKMEKLTEDLKARSVKKYDIFVTELCDGNLSKTCKKFTLTQSVDICKQLLEGLEQLEKSGKCHNDLKPENVLYEISEESYENGDQKVSIKIADFGTADRSGGTPGWTWPRFLSQRKPGKSDMYSVALLILYMMCDSRELFYRLRDNYIEGRPSWIAEFRAEPLIELVIDMMNLKPTVQECIERWEQISNDVWFLAEIDLTELFEIPWCWFEIQDNLDTAAIRVADATNLDK